MKNRFPAAAAALLLACALAGPAAAQNWPTKPVRIVVGFAAGGTTDVVARIVAQRLGEAWGQNALVETRAGASGMIAADLVAKAAPDGYTLMVTPQTSLAVAPALTGKAPYDPSTAFTPITVIGSTPTLMVVNASFPARTFPEFVELAKKGGLVYGSGGIGSSPHMAGEIMSAQLGIKMTHVPYKGENPALTDTIAGQVPIMFGNITAALPHVKSGKLRALANTGAKRSPLAPDVPTMNESGLRDFSVATWFGLLGPAGMPAELSARIQRDVAQVVSRPDLRDKLVELGVDIVASTPEEFTAYLRSEIVRYARVIKEAGIKAE
jgi:tripartite-type tricarboxylate transporter receptor subunit TctC